MTNGDFFRERWEAEQPAFRKVLLAIPQAHLDYRPHERSTGAGALAWQLAQEQRGLAELLGTARTAYEARPHPPSIDEIVAAWDAATAAVRASLEKSDDASWSKPAVFLLGGEPAWSDSLRNILWGFLFDMVHHRGQLSTYLRPMGAKVPSIYGPSGDER
jgi:uncharacterized damage-inducible protein DinB